MCLRCFEDAILGSISICIATHILRGRIIAPIFGVLDFTSVRHAVLFFRDVVFGPLSGAWLAGKVRASFNMLLFLLSLGDLVRLDAGLVVLVLSY